jgi:hypothetical protein
MFLKVIDSILSSTAKCLLNIHQGSNSYAAFKKLHWLPTEQRITYKLALLGFKIVNGTAPVYFSDNITVAVPTRSTRLSDAPILTSRQYQSKKRLVTYGDRSCFVSVCKVFNSLPADIRGSSSVMNFRVKLKTFLFVNAF